MKTNTLVKFSRLLTATGVGCWLLFALVGSVRSQQRYWIVFQDKGIDVRDWHPGTAVYDSVKARIDPISLRRRALALPKGSQVVTIDDAPVCSRYLSAIERLGITPLTQVRWENAVSVNLGSGDLQRILKLPFVSRIGLVGSSQRLQVQQPLSVFLATPIDHSEGGIRPSILTVDTNSGYDPIIYHYGNSASQLNRINVEPLHAMGLDATNVQFGEIDTGFRWRILSALHTRNVISEYDYVFHDGVTANQEEDTPGQDIHGTNTMSCAVGYEPDSLIGPAFNATIILAKTEDERSETPAEEDNYAAALEDMESHGVDITTCSLGYFNFDPGWTSYTYSDLDGKTTISAKAVQHAVRLGVLVVNAIGNSGATDQPHMISPSDADSILSVGALDVNDSIAGFSSRGPTYDGRIKPEICTPGVSVWCQSVDSVFYGLTGTSFSAPLTSSACCLIKQAHPEATAQEIRTAVIQTGNRFDHPDTAYGYGALNTYAAALQLGMILHIKNVWYDSTVHVCAGISSRFGVTSARIEYTTSDDATVHEIPMRLVEDSLIYLSDLPVRGIHGGERFTFRVVGSDAQGVANGPDTVNFTVPITATNGVKMSLYSQRSTNLFSLSVNRTGHWNLYDAAGRAVLGSDIRSISDRVAISTQSLANGPYYLLFTSDDNESVGTGVMVYH